MHRRVGPQVLVPRLGQRVATVAVDTGSTELRLAELGPLVHVLGRLVLHAPAPLPGRRDRLDDVVVPRRPNILLAVQVRRGRGPSDLGDAVPCQVGLRRLMKIRF